MVGSGSTRVALACGVFAVTAIGCGDSSGGGRTPTASVTVSTTSVPGPDYATRLNSLCAELLPKVIAIYGGGHPGPYPITVFEAEQPRITALYKTFDAEADAMPVTDADRRAVDAFAAYRRESDAATALLAAAAATGKQDRFDAAYREVHRMFDTSSTLNELHATGIGCDAR